MAKHDFELIVDNPSDKGIDVYVRVGRDSQQFTVPPFDKMTATADIVGRGCMIPIVMAMLVGMITAVL